MPVRVNRGRIVLKLLDGANHQRVHQYAGGHNENHGGATINIDSNYLDLAAGDEPPSSCAATNLDFTTYPVLSSGDSGDQVKAAQCLLKAAGHPTGDGDPSGVVDSATTSATSAFQSQIGLPSDGSIGTHTWTALLAAGDKPVLRSGSTGEAVRRLQRTLTAALSHTTAIDGQFGPATTQAVRDYQTSRQLTVDGVVGSATWTALQLGQ